MASVLVMLFHLFPGFVFGLVPAAVSTDGADWGSSDSWPTGEMQSRYVAHPVNIIYICQYIHDIPYILAY